VGVECRGARHRLAVDQAEAQLDGQVEQRLREERAGRRVLRLVDRVPLDREALERVAIEGYPIDEAKDSPPGTLFTDTLLESPVALRLGCVDGEPVSGAAALDAHGVVNLCFAATLGAGRRKGVWSALVWARVNQAPEQPSVAFTSDDSRPGFVRMGFLPMTRFTLLVRPPGASAGRRLAS